MLFKFDALEKVPHGGSPVGALGNWNYRGVIRRSSLASRGNIEETSKVIFRGDAAEGTAAYMYAREARYTPAVSTRLRALIVSPSSLKCGSR